MIMPMVITVTTILMVTLTAILSSIDPVHLSLRWPTGPSNVAIRVSTQMGPSVLNYIAVPRFVVTVTDEPFLPSHSIPLYMSFFSTHLLVCKFREAHVIMSNCIICMSTLPTGSKSHVEKAQREYTINKELT
jgi:hypothetical protein